MLRRLCVYCGSSVGNHPRYQLCAENMGQLLAKRRISLVYGAGNVGLMGTLANAVLKTGGEAIGVIPQLLVDLELAHRGLHDLHVVQTMHERKALMAELADAFVALPGGIGTLEELAEIMTWKQLKIHSKPVGLLNLDGYYDSLLDFVDTAVREGFLPLENRQALIVDDHAERLIETLSEACLSKEA
jgi:uncharacterized protein (TIGR00730 family)